MSAPHTYTEYIKTSLYGIPGELECEVSYSFDRADPGCVEYGTGLALSPSYPARVTVYSVECKGINVLPILQADQVTAMEREILREVEGELA